jgi:hypothetical protein
VLAIEGLLSGHEDQDPLARLSPIEAQQIWESVAASDLVKKLGGEQLKRLFAGAALMVWEKGELVAERGSSIERMFLVVRGQLEAFVSTPDGKVHQLRVLTRRPFMSARCSAPSVAGDDVCWSAAPAAHRRPGRGALVGGGSRQMLGRCAHNATIAMAARSQTASVRRLMSLREIVLIDPVLRRPAREVERLTRRAPGQRPRQTYARSRSVGGPRRHRRARGGGRRAARWAGRATLASPRLVERRASCEDELPVDPGSER